jgi:hypothetical protein
VGPALRRSANPKLEHQIVDERKKIGEILVSLGVLSPMAVDRVLQAKRRSGGNEKFGALAQKMGLLRQEHILAALAIQLRLVPRAHEMNLTRLLNHLQKVP